MAHSCMGEYCGFGGGWDCPNRIGRAEADKRSPEEIAEARKYAKMHMEAVGRTIIESQQFQDFKAYLMGNQKEE